MRVRFFQPSSEVETAEFLAAERGIAEFWAQFRRVQHRPAVEWVVAARELLKTVSPGLGLETENLAGQRALYVLPMDGPELTPLAEKVVSMAPQGEPWVDGWKIGTARAPLPFEAAVARVFSVTRFDLRAARVRVGIERGHALAIVVGHHLFRGTDDEVGYQAAETLVAALLGDAVFERWVSSVQLLVTPRPSPLKLVGQSDQNLPLPIGDLAETVFTAVRRIGETLPEAPLHEFCDRADWVLFELDDLEQAAGPYPLPELRVATTMCPEMLKTFLTGAPFASERFSRHGERFAYVELEASGRSREASLELRNELEEALDYALVPGRIGCVVGAGVGERNMYLFLALHSLDAAIRLVRRCFQEFALGGKTRLRFCDDEWRSEWVE